ncbi:hypothetical protein QCA50_017514 [Cerrena zonata]|uniref:Uncharacterized protein n=1 Tax=Cerrena zonata TaxID=2478898 RepID=A0AAW0FKB8_9APHY
MDILLYCGFFFAATDDDAHIQVQVTCTIHRSAFSLTREHPPVPHRSHSLSLIIIIHSHTHTIPPHVKKKSHPCCFFKSDSSLSIHSLHFFRLTLCLPSLTQFVFVASPAFLPTPRPSPPSELLPQFAPLYLHPLSCALTYALFTTLAYPISSHTPSHHIIDNHHIHLHVNLLPLVYIHHIIIIQSMHCIHHSI